MTEAENGTKNGAEAAEVKVEVTDEVKAKIVRQIEHYFGDYNLPRDKFLLEEV